MEELPPYLKDLFPEQAYNALIGKKAFAPYRHGGISLVRLRHDYRGIMRGTVAAPGGLIHAYPRIKRILHLERGIKKYLPGGFVAQEKADGYNVRVALLRGQGGAAVVAFTRGGFVCPFTLERLPELVNPSFFETHPEMILCGEVVGPENPYNTEAVPYIGEDVRFFGFDIMDGGGRVAEPGESHETLRRHGIEPVRQWGPFGPGDAPYIKELVLRLEAEGREGLVLKPIGGQGEAVKYVTPGSCLRDIEATSVLMAELPPGYYIQRLWRGIFFSREFESPPDDDYLLKLIKALYEKNTKLLGDIERGGSIAEDFQVRLRERRTAGELLRHLREAGVRAELVSLEPMEDGYWRARFRRLFTKGTRGLRRSLKGYGFLD